MNLNIFHNIEQITVKTHLCIGCGFCAAVCPQSCISMVWAKHKTWEPRVENERCHDCGLCIKVCPNSPENLQKVGERSVAEGAEFGLKTDSTNPASYCISHETNNKNRVKSASGGTTTVLLKHLLQTKAVDCVIAARPRMAKIGEPHFDATICRTPEEIDECRSSAYGPVCYDKVLTEIFECNETCAMTVLPCTQRAIDNLPEKFRKHIRHTIGIMCSHNVTDQFGDFIAYVHGIDKNTNFIINYRDKLNIPDANKYNTLYTLEDGGELRTPRMTNGYTPAWRNYWFAQECCLHCPDFYVANADISVKDAWGRLSKDPKGITLCIVRNEKIKNNLLELSTNGILQIKECDADELRNSQNTTAVFKQKNFIHRWRKHPLLCKIAEETKPVGAYSIEDNQIIKDYQRKLRTLQMTKSVFKNSSSLGFHLLCRSRNIGIRVLRGLQKLKTYFLLPLRLAKKTISSGLRVLGFLSPLPLYDNRRELPSLQGKFKDWGVPGVSANAKLFHVLLTGGYGYGNVGDEAQLGANITRWRNLVPDCRLTVFSPHPRYTRYHHDIESEWAPRVTLFNANRTGDYGRSNRRFEKQFFKVKRRMMLSARMLRAGLPVMFCTPVEAQVLDIIRQADVFHISGGGFLTGMTRSRLWENCLLMRLCYLLGTPVILTGQTIGVFKSKADRKLAKWGLENAKAIYLRDRQGSEADVRSLGIKGNHIKSTFDDALFCEKKEQETVDEILKAHDINIDNPLVTANFHYWGQTDQDKKKATERFAELCDFLVEKYNAQMLFVPMHHSDEIPEKAAIAAMTQNAKLLDYNYDYRTIRGVISRSKLCFTMKHHPIIFAHGEQVPVVSVTLDDYYYRKNSGAMENCEQERFCLPREDFFSAKAEDALSTAYENAERISIDIGKYLKQQKQREDEAMRMVLNGKT